jgi:eukaryotic-like serine/threonine-protein kinase
MTSGAGPRPPRSGEESLPRGHRVAGKYVVESVIGEGATSVVYLARVEPGGAPMSKSPAATELAGDDSEPVSLRLAALKVIHRRLSENAQIVGRFRREAAILQRLMGPHVLRVHEILEDRGLLVLVLEYVAGIPLDQRLIAAPPISVATAVEIAVQVCAGLGAAHAAGVVHRDLKPANVLFSTAEKGGRVLVKVADFGLAKLVHGDKMVTGLTEHDMIFGTPEYMAPEQARGEEVDGRADIYALGCMLYEMLTGEVPFHDSSPMATIAAHLSNDAVPLRKRRPNAGLTPALEAVVMRAMAKSPADRHSTARALAEALVAAASSLRVVAASESSFDADALGDTDLNLEAAPSEEPEAALAVEVAQGASVTPSVDAQTFLAVETDTGPGKKPERDAADDPSRAEINAAPASTSGGAPPWFWIAVAVIAALVSIGVGIALGAR